MQPIQPTPHRGSRCRLLPPQQGRERPARSPWQPEPRAPLPPAASSCPPFSNGHALNTLAQARRLSQTAPSPATNPGRKRRVPAGDSKEAVVRRVERQRARGDVLRRIADDLNDARAPTAQGGKEWDAATVRHVLVRTL